MSSFWENNETNESFVYNDLDILKRIDEENNRLRYHIVPKQKIERKRPKLTYMGNETIYSINRKLENIRQNENLYISEVVTSENNKIRYIYIQKYLAVEYIDISSNQLTILPNIFILSNLTTLIAFENKIVDISLLGKLVNLQKIILHHNFILTIPEEISNLQYLEFLDLSSNYITNIPEYASKMTNLNVLKLNSNNLNDKSNLIHLSHLTSLVDLDLSFNNIEIIPKQFKQLVNLESLKIYASTLKRIPSDVFYLCISKTQIVATIGCTFNNKLPKYVFEHFRKFYGGRSKQAIKIYKKIKNEETILTLLMCHAYYRRSHPFLTFVGKGVIKRICEFIRS